MFKAFPDYENLFNKKNCCKKLLPTRYPLTEFVFTTVFYKKWVILLILLLQANDCHEQLL